MGTEETDILIYKKLIEQKLLIGSHVASVRPGSCQNHVHLRVDQSGRTRRASVVGTGTSVRISWTRNRPDLPVEPTIKPSEPHPQKNSIDHEDLIDLIEA